MRPLWWTLLSIIRIRSELLEIGKQCRQTTCHGTCITQDPGWVPLGVCCIASVVAAAIHKNDCIHGLEASWCSNDASETTIMPLKGFFHFPFRASDSCWRALACNLAQKPGTLHAFSQESSCLPLTGLVSSMCIRSPDKAVLAGTGVQSYPLTMTKTTGTADMALASICVACFSMTAPVQTISLQMAATTCQVMISDLRKHLGRSSNR